MKSMAFPAKKVMMHLYAISLALLFFTGFGQLPIYRRYYFNEIPGLDWSANFYATHLLHHVGAMILIFVGTALLTGYIISGRKRFRLTVSGWVRTVLLSALFVTGVFRVLKNMPDITFSPELTFFIDVSHLALAVIFLVAGLAMAIARRPWLRER